MTADTPRIARICVFRALQLGDLICATPALRALRRRFPDARITLVGLPWAADFALRMGEYVDDFVEFPGWPGLPERGIDLEAVARFIDHMQRQRFDLAVQLHGNGRLTNPLVRAFGARHTIGYCPGSSGVAVQNDENWANGSYWPYPEALHEVHRNLQLIARLAPGEDDDRVVFPLIAADEVELRRLRPDLARLDRGSFVCLHPGARHVAKRWAPARFARVGDALARQGWRIVLTGSGAETELAAEVADRMQAPALNAACDIPIGALAVLLSRSRLLVSNDTGVAHVAAGLRLPSVVVFFATDPRRWAPLDDRRHVVIHDPVGVAPETVLEAAQRLLVRAPDGHDPVACVTGSARNAPDGAATSGFAPAPSDTPTRIACA